MKDIIEKFQIDPSDTGSASVQVIYMTQRILSIAEHTKTHKKDFHCRRGLMQCISKRKSLLKYIKKGSVQKYQDLIKALGLRH